MQDNFITEMLGIKDRNVKVWEVLREGKQPCVWIYTQKKGNRSVRHAGIEQSGCMGIVTSRFKALDTLREK